MSETGARVPEGAVWGVVFGLGFVAIVEGLVLALAPSHLRAVLEMLERLDREARRAIGLTAVTIGVALIWIAHG